MDDLEIMKDFQAVRHGLHQDELVDGAECRRSKLFRPSASTFSVTL